jgi:hypothetical protein
MTNEKESLDHTPKVDESGNPKYPFIVTCPCAWQALAKTRDQAEYHKRHHESASLMLKATKGWQIGH